MSSNIKIFKLNYSGSFEEIHQENLLQYFTLFDIITFYNPLLKRLFIWIGKKASQTLKSHIPRLRELFYEQYPELKILRNITIDSGSESSEFLETVGLSRTELDKHIRNLEIKLLPSVSEINKLKEIADKKFLSENYEEVITVGEKILRLAREIDDESLEIDQKNFIREAQTRIQTKNKLDDIEKECMKALNEFQNLVDKNKIKDAHKIVSALRKKYKNYFNIYSISIFRDLILKDEKLLFSLNSEQNRLKDQLDDLEIRFNRNLNQNYLEKANLILKDAKELANKLIEEQISKRWDFYDSKLKEAKDALINRIESLSKNALNFLDRGEIVKTLEIFEKIIYELDKNTKVD
ncbi:MAG: hypothetical protein ACFFBW_04970 [Promethearchaeota archaeon]